MEKQPYFSPWRSPASLILYAPLHALSCKGLFFVLAGGRVCNSPFTSNLAAGFQLTCQHAFLGMFLYLCIINF